MLRVLTHKKFSRRFGTVSAISDSKLVKFQTSIDTTLPIF